MASLVSCASGNLTSSSTWALIDSTSELDSEAGTTTIPNSNVDSSTFQPGAITVDGIGLKLQARTTSPSGTFTVTLRNSTAGTDVASVTVNVADLTYRGWHFFKFSSSQTLAGSTDYLIRVACSVGGNLVTLYRNGTGNNHARFLRTTTTQAPAANDKLHICGEFTGAGTGNDIAVTMDSTATTSYGSTSPPCGVTVNKRASFVCGTSTSTNYIFYWKGLLEINPDGLFEVGNSSTRIPSSSTALYVMDSASAVDTGLVCYGTFHAYGTAMTNPWSKLTATANSSQAVLLVEDTTGWNAGDQVLIGGTTKNTNNQTEDRTILTVDSSTQITVSSNLSNAHHYLNSDMQGEVANCTRNVMFEGSAVNKAGWMRWTDIHSSFKQTMQASSCRFRWLGSADAFRTGVVLYSAQNTSSSPLFEDCVFIAPGNQGGFGGVRVELTPKWTFNRCVFAQGILLMLVDRTGTTTSDRQFTNNLQIDGWLAGHNWWDVNFVMSNCRWSCVYQGSANRLRFYTGAGPTNRVNRTFDWSNLHFHNCSSSLGWESEVGGTIDGITTWRNTDYGLIVSAGVGPFCSPLIIKNGLFVSNTSGDIGFGNTTNFPVFDVRIYNTRMCGWTGDGNAFTGFRWSAGFGQRVKLTLENVRMDATGSYVIHTGTDFYVDTTGTWMSDKSTAKNCKFGYEPATALLMENCELACDNYGQTDDHRTYKSTGKITYDTAIYNSASPSQRLTPAIISTFGETKHQSGSVLIPIASGGTVNVGVYVRKSASGDGTAYSGSQPRLIVKSNAQAGITSDTVLDTMTASTGSWEQLTGTISSVPADCVVELYVDCDGAASSGWVNVDDWSYS